MAIQVCHVKSPLTQVSDTRIFEYLRLVSDALGEELELVEMETLEKAPFRLVYVASGGSEGIFLQKYQKDRFPYDYQS